MNKIGLIIKKNSVTIIISVILIALSFYHKDSFLVVMLIYGLLLKLLASKLIKGKVRKYLSVVIWASLAIMIVLMFYVNHYLPHGPSYPTGDYESAFDGRGPAAEIYHEDMSKLDIPDWAKFVRSSAGWCLIFFLVIAGSIASGKNDNNDQE
jgi:hypothetical protein